MPYSIYKHTNKKNGKSYVGITSMKPEKRWRNGLGYSDQPKFFNAIIKYGWDGFTHEILATCDDKTTACELEASLIKKFDCVENGYNIHDSVWDMSSAASRMQVDKYDINTGKLICTYPSIIDASNDTGASDSHISECCRGIHKTAGGYGWAYHGEPYEVPKKCYRWSKIEQINILTGNVIAVYNSQKEAAEAVNVSRSLINQCCKNNMYSGGGYLWRYSK